MSRRRLGVSIMPLDNRRDVLVGTATRADALGYDGVFLPETWAYDITVLLAEAAVRTRRIVLGDTLINEFSTDEIETVLAHELGHHVHRDIPFLIVFGTLSTTLSLYIASLALDWAVGFFGFTGPADIAAFPALLLIFGAKRLPEMGRSLGKGMREFKDSVTGVEEAVSTTTPTPKPAELSAATSEPSRETRNASSADSRSSRAMHVRKRSSSMTCSI